MPLRSSSALILIGLRVPFFSRPGGTDLNMTCGRCALKSVAKTLPDGSDGSEALSATAVSMRTVCG